MFLFKGLPTYLFAFMEMVCKGLGKHTGQETCTRTVTNVPLWIFTFQTVLIEYIASVKRCTGVSNKAVLILNMQWVP